MMNFFLPKFSNTVIFRFKTIPYFYSKMGRNESNILIQRYEIEMSSKMAPKGLKMKINWV